MMNLIVTLSLTVSAGVSQFVAARFMVTCKLKPVEGEGQYICAVFVVVSLILNTGAQEFARRKAPRKRQSGNNFHRSSVH